MQELWKRTRRGVKHPSYVMFFLVAILGVGAVGIWIELYTWLAAKPAISNGSIRTSLVAFVPAFMASTSMQLIWAESQRSLRATALTLAFVCMIGWIFCKILPPENDYAIFAGVFSSLVALWTWWIANANQADIMDGWSPEVTKGPINLDVKLAGDVSGFRTE